MINWGKRGISGASFIIRQFNANYQAFKLFVKFCSFEINSIGKKFKKSTCYIFVTRAQVLKGSNITDHVISLSDDHVQRINHGQKMACC